MPFISNRTKSLGTEHAFVVLAEVNKLIAEKRPIISFAIGQPDFITPGNIREAAKRAMDEGKTGYTASAGIPELRSAVADTFRRTRKIDVTAPLPAHMRATWEMLGLDENKFEER